MEEKGMSRREKRRRYRMRRNRIGWMALALASMVMFFYAGYHLWGYYAEYREEEALKHELAELRADYEVADKSGAGTENGGSQNSAQDEKAKERTPEDIAAFYRAMKEKNEDYVFWLSVDGTAIDYPVVKKDNSFYLNHDFAGEKNRHGSIFLDETCELGDEVLLVHGHHMKDGTMFGDLKKYKEEDFRKRYGTIHVECEEGIRAYHIFAVAQIDLMDEESFRYEVLPETEEEKALYIEGLDAASFWYERGLSFETLQKLRVIVFSTCDYGTQEQRLLVAAREITSSESGVQ